MQLLLESGSSRRPRQNSKKLSERCSLKQDTKTLSTSDQPPYCYMCNYYLIAVENDSQGDCQKCHP